MLLLLLMLSLHAQRYMCCPSHGWLLARGARECGENGLRLCGLIDRGKAGSPLPLLLLLQLGFDYPRLFFSPGISCFDLAQTAQRPAGGRGGVDRGTGHDSRQQLLLLLLLLSLFSHEVMGTMLVRCHNPGPNKSGVEEKSKIRPTKQQTEGNRTQQTKNNDMVTM